MSETSIPAATSVATNPVPLRKLCMTVGAQGLGHIAMQAGGLDALLGAKAGRQFVDHAFGVADHDARRLPEALQKQRGRF